MEDDTWSFGLSTSSSSRSYQSVLKSLSDLCIDFEEIEEEDDDELRTEYQCPYCTDDFDLVELCSHVDEEHYLEAKSGRLELLTNAHFVIQFSAHDFEHSPLDYGIASLHFS
ncbi:DROUGHT-INDUCED PROTEIN [Salix viminalis]|uniref:DROUGHT-INDUCED PROTEIN n=1 Tax=Salix viminalis TaxID=40686 RepID=A0A9Q0UFX4_SALVM|nr:DROUGHT-INDUCED PROTEIN [Salix viminalis]